ncbi:SRPBCC domain-containing protein [Alkalihalobacillus trypoxylicola]|uniref:Activator of Hsp90 ATPase homologue 1/2-like C-terminal domain-containing protein n=1 Tax=Alkalihalobacillus trypoxylicola TaxID=519424 RepID=A0A162F3M1_9BACI|nr:SRPBCC domain-containing protein [Alkalihalobacillus trypoxylicola]KYG34419.1 hypothetical protein AZF04_14640 [Alkalihalobacillus trypoxylicola]
MKEELIVRDQILIGAPPSVVWEILINPKFVAQWDELPDDYPQERMTLGSKVVWDLPNGEQSITKLIKVDTEHELIISLLVTGWKLKPNEGDIAYHYTLQAKGEKTLLKINIGDFALINDGQLYYDASIEFTNQAKTIIKTLSEDKQGHSM